MLLLALLASFLVSNHALAASPDDAFFDSLKTENINITKFESCDPSGSSGDPGGISLPVAWKPNGFGEYVQPATCSSETLESQILSAANEDQRKDVIKKFFATCGERLSSFNHGSQYAMAMFAGTRYAYCNHPRVRRLRLKFDDGTRLGGVIAIQRPNAHGIDQPRPLVIYKCGVFCETEDSSTKLMVMQMFDQAPFNVIAVGNNTTADFTADNNYVAMGGYDEGMQLIRLARLVRNSPLGKLTTSIHIIGMSLAGNAALMSSYINEHNLDAMNSPYYASVMALCPVVDLQPSINYLFADNVRGRVSREVLMRNIKNKKEGSPLLTELYQKLSNADHISLIPGILANYASSYYSKEPSSWMLPPLNESPITTPESLWQVNNFFRYASTPINTPTLAIGALDDWVVVPEANSVKLVNFLESSRLQTKLKAVVVPYGNHCAFAPVYGYDTISRLYESFVMSHAPEMLARKHQVKSEFDGAKYFTGGLALQKGERYVRASLELKQNSSSAKLSVQIWGSDSWTDKSCLTTSLYSGDSKCLRVAQTEIPLSALGSWTRVPSTEPEAEQLTRWANFNLRWLHSDGSALIESQNPPQVLTWDEF